MLDISVGCTNENTYGVSCHMCGDCGRKFTMNGVDDSEVVDKKAKTYAEYGMEADSYLTCIKLDTKKRICSCCVFYDKPTYVACRHCQGFDKFECKYGKPIFNVDDDYFEELVKGVRAGLTPYGIEVKDDE